MEASAAATVCAEVSEVTQWAVVIAFLQRVRCRAEEIGQDTGTRQDRVCDALGLEFEALWKRAEEELEGE